MAGNKMGEDTRDKILTAAQAAFLEQGYQAATVQGIADRAEVTKMMLFYHFENKQNLFRAVVRSLVDEIGTAFQATFPEIRGDSPQAFQQQLHAMLGFYRQHTDLLRLILSEWLRSPGQGVVELAMFEEIFSLILSHTPGAPSAADQARLVRLFFFNALPMLFYASLEEELSKGYGLESQRVEEAFVQTFARVFMENVGG